MLKMGKLRRERQPQARRHIGMGLPLRRTRRILAAAALACLAGIPSGCGVISAASGGSDGTVTY
jgi:hypothetical protein